MGAPPGEPAVSMHVDPWRDPFLSQVPGWSETDHQDDHQDHGHHDGQQPAYRFTPGGSFILDTDPDPQPLWGAGSEVLQADGEALILAARQGLGKSSLAQQLTLGRCGFEEYRTLLGFPILRVSTRSIWPWTGRSR